LRDLSLHILDLLENALRAGATTLRVTVEEDAAQDRLAMAVEDDGPGIDVPPDHATDPFYTTGPKRLGLGLGLFKETALEAGGAFHIGRSELGGAAVCASFQLSHVNRKPFGNLAETLFAMACTHPEVELQCVLKLPTEEHRFTRTPQPLGTRPALADARRFAKQVRAAAKHMEA
jgi:anti-sigma regulatory factor (Ser/Thr protein kinase)